MLKIDFNNDYKKQ